VASFVFEQPKESTMAGHDCPPPHQPREEPCDAEERALDPYVSFVGVFLRQVITDALSTPKGSDDWTDNNGSGAKHAQREAQAFLLDLNRLAPWVELTGADVDKMQHVLLHAAGLTKASYGDDRHQPDAEARRKRRSHTPTEPVAHQGAETKRVSPRHAACALSEAVWWERRTR